MSGIADQRKRVRYQIKISMVDIMLQHLTCLCIVHGIVVILSFNFIVFAANLCDDGGDDSVNGEEIFRLMTLLNFYT